MFGGKGIQVKIGDHTVRLTVLLGFCVTMLKLMKTDEKKTKQLETWKYEVVDFKVTRLITSVCVCSAVVLYVERCRRHRWRCAEVTFTCPEEALCERWVSSIREQLAAISTTCHQHTPAKASVIVRLLVTLLLFFFFSASRPKHLLVYINPYGGKRQGKHIYEQKVAPLFALAGISTDVIGTYHLTHFLLLGFLCQHF